MGVGKSALGQERDMFLDYALEEVMLKAVLDARLSLQRVVDDFVMSGRATPSFPQHSHNEMRNR